MKKNILKTKIKNMTKHSLFLFFFFCLTFPSQIFAAESVTERLNINLNWILGGNRNSRPDMANASLEQVFNIINRVTTYAIDLAGLLVFIMIIYSTIMYATAFGEESKAETAKKALTWSIVGLVVIILFRVIINIVQTALQ
jgi:hypothetical protein